MKRLLAILISLSALFFLTGCEKSASSDISPANTFSGTTAEAYDTENSPADTSVTETDITTSEEVKNENDPINLKGTVYELIGAYVDDENNVLVDMTNWQVSEDYDMFRQYFFGEWDAANSTWDTNVTIDDSEDFLAMDRYIYFYENFFQISDTVLAFTTGLNAEIKIFWLETDKPDIMYADEIEPSGWFAGFDFAKADVLTKTPTAPKEPSNNFLSIFKLHEMAHNHDIPLDLLTNIDYGIIDGKYFLHSARADFYPMYLVSEADDKIEIRTSIGNFMETDIELISVLCTFKKEGGEWNRTVEEV